LVELAPRVGLRVAVVAQGAVAADFPDADTVLASDEASAVSAQLSATPFVVVATQGRRDLQGLKAGLALQPQGLWFVSSAKKASVLRSSLVTSGEDPAAVARIVAPAGEFIGAQTPEEIALSVLTSVVAARRGRETQAAEVVSAPAATSSCCGGASDNNLAPMMNVAPAAELATVTVAVPAKSSCCGG
jgi:xanthine dehydrogenase accessory factor